MYILKEEDSQYIVNENYFYKTEPYYAIVENENEGIRTTPSSRDVLDAYIVPVCLEKAKLAGISVCDWTVSYQFVPIPAIIYGLNYFSTPRDSFLVSNNEEAQKVVKHITNHGRYPFCYQKVSDASAVTRYVSIFGRSINCCEEVAQIAEKIYQVFKLPLVEIVLVKDNSGSYSLSSLAPVKYSQLSKEEKEMLQDLLDRRVKRFE